MEKLIDYKRRFFKESSSEQMYKGDDYYDNLASDEHAMREIELFTENDSDIYRQTFQSIIKNIKQKLKSGRYNHALAPKLWGYYVEAGMKKYAKEVDGDPKNWMNLLNTKDRKVLALKCADYYFDAVVRGEYDSSPVKTMNASKVLQLMDNDASYQEAIKQISDDANVSPKQIEVEVSPFI